MNCSRHRLLIYLLFNALISFSQLSKIAKENDWVKPVEIPGQSEVSKYDVSSGSYVKLADYQINLDENAFYSHEIVKVMSIGGITKASQLFVTFDTSYQKLKIHHLFIWRKGEKIDRTKNLSFELMNNEYNLQNGIYMGRVTAYDNLDDIRKDDLIDFSYSLFGKNPIYKNGKHLFIPLEVSDPVDLYYCRILYSKDKDYDIKCVGCDSTIIVKNTVQAKYREIEISLKDLKPSKFEDNIPSWIIPYKYFTLSSYKNWTEINSWAQGVFALKTQPNLESVHKEIFTGTETRDEKINKLINFVQDDIRYMGIEAGIGSIKPFPPNQVVKQRFGDCKDKSLLLVSLLKSIGVKEAYPALVNVSLKNALKNEFPSSELFNHCIVNFIVDSISYWVDPTITQQGGEYKNMSMPDYGLALIIGAPSDSLVKIPALDLKSATKIRDELTAASFSEPSKLEIKSTRYGSNADMRRVDLEQNSLTELSKIVLEDLKLIYPSAKATADIIVKDEPLSNIISTTYNYEVNDYWKDGNKMSDKNLEGYWIFKFEPSCIYDYFKMIIGSERKYDYALPYPLNLNYRVIFHFPKELMIHDNYLTYDNSAFSFDLKTEQLSSNSLQITYNLITKTPIIKAADFAKIAVEKDRIVNTLTMMIYFNK